MAGVYGRQFHKMLGNLAQHYLPALEAKAEKDTSEFWELCELDLCTQDLCELAVWW